MRPRCSVHRSRLTSTQRVRLGIVTLACACLLSHAHFARAAAKSQDVTSVDSIRRFMEKGQALFVAGQYAKAAEVFETGYELHPYSAFLFNAGVAFEKSERLDEALARFKKYLDVDKSAPDRADVERRIERIERELADRTAAEKAGKKPEVAPRTDTTEEATKSLVIVETEPPGATVHFYQQVAKDAKFEDAKDNPGFKPILSDKAPANVSLDVGHYHIVVDAVADFNPSEADLDVLPGHLHQLKLNLSQGAFMAYLRLAVTPRRAQVYLDDPQRQKAPWSQGTHGELVRTGAHQLLVVAPGFTQLTRELTLLPGQKEELSVALERVSYGEIRIDSNAHQIQVAVDGRPVGSWTNGQHPLSVRDLPAGSHRLSVTSEGRKPLVDTVDVPRGQVRMVRAIMVVTPPRGAAWTQAVFEADRRLLDGNLKMRLSGQVDSMNYTFRGVRKDGALIDVEVHGSRMDYQGMPHGGDRLACGHNSAQHG